MKRNKKKEREGREKDDWFPGGGSAGVASRYALRCAHVCGEKLMSSGCNWCEYFMAAEGRKRGADSQGSGCFFCFGRHPNVGGKAAKCDTRTRLIMKLKLRIQRQPLVFQTGGKVVLFFGLFFHC